jgi:hypothetical protein
MSTAKSLRLTRFVKTLLDIIFGLLVFACIGLVLWIALSPLILGEEGNLATASISVAIGSGDEPQIEVTFTNPTKDAINAAFVEEAEGILRLETSSLLLVLIANTAKLVVAIGLAYVFHLLRTVVQTILDGDPFAAENGQRIRRLGYAVLLVGILWPCIDYIAAVEILKRLPTAVPALSPGSAFDSEVILATLLILLLSQIWSYGLELEREQALTI